jgi:hypothetical protein
MVYRLALLALALTFACTLQAASTVVYRSVDGNGVVSFSDTPPATDTPSRKLEIATPSGTSTRPYLQRLEAMRTTTDRMVRDRLKRERQRLQVRLARQRQALREAAAAPAVAPRPDPQVVIYPLYPPPHYHPDLRRGHRDRRALAPHRRHPQTGLERNRQLMRPLLQPVRQR